jgi:hypothetical protein
MKKNTLILAIILTVFTFGCATTSTVGNSVTSETVMSDFDETWAKVIRFFSTNQIGIGTLEKESGIVTIDGQNLAMDLMKKYCDTKPAVPFLWSPLYGTAKGSVTLIDEGDFVTANVNVSFNVTSAYGANRIVNSCTSSSVFEDSLLDTLRS